MCRRYLPKLVNDNQGREIRGISLMDRLPAELILDILNGLDILDLASLIFAIFPILRHHRIAPAISMGRIEAMRRRSIPQHARRPGIQSLPPELRLYIGQTLNAREKINFVIATWPIINWDLRGQ